MFGGPALQLGEASGLECADTRALGRARAVDLASRLRLGDVLGALRVRRALDEMTGVREADAAIASRAWAALPAPAALRTRSLGDHGLRVGRWLRYGALAILPEGILLRGSRPRLVQPSDGISRPLGLLEGAEPPLRDPSGALTVLDVRRTCRGYVVTIVPPTLAQPGVEIAPGAELLIEARAAPADVRCDSPPSAFRDDDGGWSLLAWAPQGLLVARGAELRMVPMDASGRAAGPPTPLEAGDPMPAPLRGPGVTPGGEAYLALTAEGVLLRRLHPREQTLLLRPEGWSPERPIHAAAISENGEQIALLMGDALLLLEGF